MERSGELKPIRTRYHRVWDSKVREIAGGLSIFPVVMGHWVSPSQELFVERMIPVRVFCEPKQIESIADMTAEYYNQEAVMYYSVSRDVNIKYYGETK